MRQQLVLVFCWVVMFGNVAIVVAAPGIALCYRDLLPLEIEASVVAVLSFCCALLLRGRVVKSLRASPSTYSKDRKREHEEEGKRR